MPDLVCFALAWAGLLIAVVAARRMLLLWVTARLLAAAFRASCLSRDDDRR